MTAEVKQKEAWQEYLEPKNPLMELFAGKNPAITPSMPICQATSSLPFQARRIVEKWIERVGASGGNTIDINFDDYVAVRVEVFKEIFEKFVPRYSWFNTPTQASKEGLEGSKIQIRGEEIFHLTGEGKEHLMGSVAHPKSEDILAGAADEVAVTWDSTLGWKSFKETPEWDPPANRVEEFKRGIKYEINDSSSGDEGSIGSEPWIPAKAMGGTEVLHAVCIATEWAHTPYDGATSPFQNACYQLGFEGLMESIYLAPELVHKAAEMAYPKDGPGYKRTKESGVGIVYMFQMYGGGDLLGPKQFEQVVAPEVQAALDFYHERGFWVVYYPMGNATPHLEPMKDLNWDALSLEESRKGYEIDLKRVREVMGPDRLLFGNMPVEHIDQGNKEAMLKEARYQIKHAGQNGHFILSCGTPVMPGTPAEHVRYFCKLPEIL